MKNNLIVNEVKVLKRKYGTDTHTDFINLTCDYNAITIDEKNLKIIIPVYEKSVDLSFSLEVNVHLVPDQDAAKLCEMIRVLFYSFMNNETLDKNNTNLIERLKHCLDKENIEIPEAEFLMVVNDLCRINKVEMKKIFAVKSVSLHTQKCLDTVYNALENKGVDFYQCGYRELIEELIKEKVISFPDNL